MSKKKISSLVHTRTEDLVLQTYLPAPPDKNPMFLEKRVYQGSSGKVYPLPFTDRIAEKPVDRVWKAVWIENEFLRALVLPELGGRIHALQDKTNRYDLIYRQEVIKPALVGLAGPWISGGIEFNWPQHHRPATFLPTDFEIEKHADGSQTIWCSDHDPMTRMKGMHGVCLHPGRSVLEVKVRAYNRTPFTQTFLWWANVATRVHESYQSFFPPDVHYVADHARRSMTEYPHARGFYYGVDYGERRRQGVPQGERPAHFQPPHREEDPAKSGPKDHVPTYAPDDLTFYANIPTPCSYMCVGSHEDFFGGYDHKARAGIVHFANHHISPGKKQWTWGNHDFGYAWDRHLTDADANGEHAPYIEIMAGVYTDNQPDFSFLQPGETKTWSQFWYPIQTIGPALHANLEAAVSVRQGTGESRASIVVGVSVTRKFLGAKVVLLSQADELIFSADIDLAPGAPFLKELDPPAGVSGNEIHVRVIDQVGQEVISYRRQPHVQGEPPSPATEPARPTEIPSNDELFITGLHLAQYRHTTSAPTAYWREALRRDRGDARCNNAMGLWHLHRGEFTLAERFFRRGIERLTQRNANPSDGETFYNLGLCLRFVGRDGEAYDAFYKACWNQAWMAAGYHALAEIDCCRRNWSAALEHLNHSLRFDTDNLRARNLKAIVLRQLGREDEARTLLRATLALDPMDRWARCLHEGSIADAGHFDAQTRLDVAHDFARAGFAAEAVRLLETVRPAAGDLPDQSWGALPLVEYTLGWLHETLGDQEAAFRHFQHAAGLAADYCFPARLEEIAVLEAAMRANPSDARAPYYLGNLLYDRRRHAEAIKLWELSAKLDPKFSIVWRNLGIGWFNISKKRRKARAAYDRAVETNPDDARLLYERDQLWKRLGEKPAKRLRELEAHSRLVSLRDDLNVEFCDLLNQTGRHDEVMERLAKRNFQPWEGGEGAALGQHVRTQLALGRVGLARRDFQGAAEHFKAALQAPHNLGEAKHLLANQSDIHYWLGVALEALDETKRAREHWRNAVDFRGDFQEMRVVEFSEMTFYSALSLQKLGHKAKAKKLLLELLEWARQLQKTEAKTEYFATSLPTMLLFDDDLQYRQETTALFLQAQAFLGLGKLKAARQRLILVLKRDPNHALAADLLASSGKNVI